MTDFHRVIGEWWRDVAARGDKPKTADIAFIHDLVISWKSKDAQNYADFVKLPLNRESVRVTRPEILHGSTPSGTRASRRIILS